MAIADYTRMPLDLHEIGSSAGLNLFFDRFHYRYGGRRSGDQGSSVQLAPEVIGKPLPLNGKITVARRSGCDIAPVDLDDDGQRMRLRSFVWADQAARLQRLDAAIAIARKAGRLVRQMKADDYVARSLDERMTGTAFVLFHSIMWQYMGLEERARIERLVENASASKDAPIAWLRMEPLDTSDGHATLTLMMRPDEKTMHLAKCDYHGRWMECLS